MPVSLSSLIFLAAFGLTGVSHAEPLSPLQIGKADFYKASVYPAVEVFRTPDASLTPVDVLNQEFRPAALPGHVPAFGFADDYLWFHFRIHNRAADPQMVLALDHIYLNQVTLYTLTANDFTKHALGLDVPFNEKELPYYGYAWKVKIDTGTTAEFLIRAKSRFPVSLPLTIYDHDSFQSELRKLDRFFWLYIGIILVLIAYNFIIFASVRDITYFYYICSLLSLHLFTNLTQYGLTRIYFLPDWIWFHSHVFYFAHFTSVISAYYFARSFLNIPKQFPKISQFLALLALNNFPLLLAGLTLNTSTIDSLCQLNTTLFTLTLLFTAYLGIFWGNRQSIFFAMAWTCILIFWIFNFLRIDGFVAPSLYANYSILLGAVLEGVLLSFALTDRLNQLRRRSEKVEQETRETTARNLIARQVAHDIRSPLTALEFATHNLDGVSEQRRILIRGAAQRIKDIANDLMDMGKDIVTTPIGPRADTVCLVHLADMIGSEKRVQLQGISNVKIREIFPATETGIFVVASSAELRRVVSNLLDNAIEASPPKGEVTLEIRTEGGRGILEVRDAGTGIDPVLLPKLGVERISFGKSGGTSGSGLGLFHAGAVAKKWQGTLAINSHPGNGTCVRLEFPVAAAPYWIVTALDLDSPVVVLDNDSTVRELWRTRLRRVDVLSSVEEFDSYAGALGSQRRIWLIDYDLGNKARTGLDVIDSLDGHHTGILVTSYFDDPDLVNKCKARNIKIFPKPYIRTARIELRAQSETHASL